MEGVRMDPKAYEATKYGNLHLLNLVDEEYLFNQTTLKETNILHVAAQYKQVNLIEHLLLRPLGPSLLWQGNKKGDTPLHVATKVGSCKVVRVFIDLAKSLYWVVEKGQVDACEELLRKTNLHKDTTLHYAVRGGHELVVKLLIEEDPQLGDITNATDESPLYLAAHQRRSDIIELILDAFPLSCKGCKGLIALHVAMHYSLPNWEKILEKRPEAIREGDGMGWAPLHYAACFGNVEAVRLLLQHDTSVAYNLDEEGQSALHIAAFRGHINVIDELVTSCPDACDIINTKGQMAFHAAVIGGQVKVVQHILKMPNLEDLINEEDTDGNTALHLAVLHRRYRVVFMLVRDKRVHRFATNKDHLTALDIFFACGEVDFANIQVCQRLKGSHGFPVIQDWVMENVKKSLDKQFVEGQLAGSITSSSNTANRENSYSSITSIIDAQLLVAAFIATVTFATTFTMPGGYSSDGPDKGLATLSGRAAFQAFVIFNTIAFSFSTFALFLQYDTSFLSDQEKVRYAKVVGSHIYIAILGMVLAFASGTYVVLTRTIGLGIVPYVLIGVLVAKYFYAGFCRHEIRFGALRIHPAWGLRKARFYYGIR